MQKTKSKIGWDAAYLTGSRLMVAIIGLVTSMLLARFRSLGEYGTYSQLIMVTDLVSSIIMLGVPNSISFFLAKADTDAQRQKFMSVYLSLTTLLTIIIGVSLYFSMPLIIAYFNNPVIETFAYVFAVYPWSTIMINSLANTCVVCGKAKSLVTYNVLNAITVLVVLLVAKYAGWSFQQYMIAYMSVLAIYAFYGIGWIRQLIGRLKFSLDWILIKDILKFSIPMGLAAVVGTLNVELDKLVIGGFYSTDEYAIFTNAAKEMPVTMVTVSLTAVILPQMVRLLKHGGTTEVIKLWGIAIELSLCLMCLLVGGFIVFAPDILSLFYSEKYVTDASIIVFRIYTCILLFRAVYWGIILNASGRTKFILYSSLLTLLLNFVGNIGFYYVMGFVGPAVSTLVVTASMAFIQLLFTSKVINYNIYSIFPWQSMGKLILQITVFSTAFYILKYLIIGDYPREQSIIISIGLGALWSLIYLLFNFRFIKSKWSALNEYKL